MKRSILILSSIASLYFMSCGNSNSENSNTVIQKNDNSKTEIVSTNFKSQKSGVTVDEAYELSKQGAVFVDVREPHEIAEVAYDVKEIINIPMGELESRLSEIPKDKQVILVCKRGRRSKKAYDLLKEKGYENISNMEGGMDEWEVKGLPVIKRK